MTEEHVEIVRRHVAAYTHDVASALSFLDRNVVVDLSRLGAFESTAAVGHEAVAQALRAYVGTFEEYTYEVDQFTDLGSGAILASVTETGRGKGSGAQVRHSVAMLYEVIDGKIVRITGFSSKEEALRSS